jgi:predicted RNase H-like HicB family nuclease
MANYRIIVSYLEEKKAFIARAPELEGCEAQGESRQEALATLEEEMAAQIENMEEQGIAPPQPLDEQDLDGQLSVKVTQALHRDLVFMAKAQKVELETLLVELLSQPTSYRGAGQGRPRSEGRGRQREGQGRRYHNIMENREDFIEYVRGLDHGGGGGRSGGRGGGRRGKR